MAIWLNPVEAVSRPAAADLSAKQFNAVKMDSSGNYVVAAAATDAIVGSLQNKPILGEPCLVYALGCFPVKLGPSVSAVVGSELTSADGTWSVATSGDTVAAIATQVGSSGAIITAQGVHYTA